MENTSKNDKVSNRYLFDKAFRDFYEQAIEPELNDTLEQIRTVDFRSFFSVNKKTLRFIAFIILLGSISILMFLFSISALYFFLLVLGAFMFYPRTEKSIDIDYAANNMKSKIFDLIFKYYYPEVVHRTGDTFYPPDIEKSRLYVDIYKKKIADNVFNINRKGVDLAIYSIIESTRHDLFMIVDYNKPFSSHTSIYPKNKTPKINYIQDNAKLQSVLLENTAFSKKFNVISDDQVEARYLLTLNTMEKLLRFQMNLGSEMYFSFVSGKMYIRTSLNFKLFDIRNNPVVDNYMILTKHAKYILRMIAVVEELDLNSDIWK